MEAKTRQNRTAAMWMQLLHGVKDEITLFIGYSLTSIALSRQTHSTMSVVQATQQDTGTQPEKVTNPKRALDCISSVGITHSKEERFHFGRLSQRDFTLHSRERFVILRKEQLDPVP